MLKMTKNELELILDHDMYIFSENGTRGGIYHVSHRYSKVNNRYLESITQIKNQNIIYT